MASLPIYSTLFSCLHDEAEPVGSLGRGTHYSVLRSVEWLDVVRKPLAMPQVHDFAVIWDEDHDTRIIPLIERIYIAGLLSPVQFIGERKGGLSVIVAAKFYYHGKEAVLGEYRRAIADIAANISFDSWTSEVGMFDQQPGSVQNDTVGIISADEGKVETYLRNIDNLWQLGTRNYEPRRDSLSPELFQPEPFPFLPTPPLSAS
ncbi:hypothetical protein [Aureimonas pseudogalii]|uniref:Uncharacterized protein n=1 Tax=Aureimonas pseudogalii TaxID=1744844 RepID=A0A7W6H970_9HYPH|nr:hypothetical protein [Aureimonas pseudogalii]MBB4000940.1 hypothetical protein [Aureimonas pseudogalii]